MDTNTILILAVIGAAYYGYTQGWFSSLLGSSATSTTPATGTSVPVVAPVTPPANVYSDIVAAVGTGVVGPNAPEQLTVDAWSGWLKQALISQGAVSATWYPPSCPDLYPGALDSVAAGGIDARCSALLPLDQYMALVIPWLQQNGIQANFGGQIVATDSGPIWVPPSLSGLGGLQSWSV